MATLSRWRPWMVQMPAYGESDAGLLALLFLRKRKDHKEGVRMSRSMADVLAEHPEPEVENGYWYCMCGHDYGVNFNTDTIYDHQAAALSAAGFGLVADAKAEAWDECAGQASRPNLQKNPYRKELSRRRGQPHQRTGNEPTGPQPETTYPPEPQWGTDKRGRFQYVDYDGESLHIWSAGADGALWVDKKGQGPVYVRAEDIEVITSKLRQP